MRIHYKESINRFVISGFYNSFDSLYTKYMRGPEISLKYRNVRKFLCHG